MIQAITFFMETLFSSLWGSLQGAGRFKMSSILLELMASKTKETFNSDLQHTGGFLMYLVSHKVLTVEWNCKSSMQSLTGTTGKWKHQSLCQQHLYQTCLVNVPALSGALAGVLMAHGTLVCSVCGISTVHAESLSQHYLGHWLGCF